MLLAAGEQGKLTCQKADRQGGPVSMRKTSRVKLPSLTVGLLTRLQSPLTFPRRLISFVAFVSLTTSSGACHCSVLIRQTPVLSSRQ